MENGGRIIITIAAIVDLYFDLGQSFHIFVSYKILFLMGMMRMVISIIVMISGNMQSLEYVLLRIYIRRISKEEGVGIRDGK